MNLSEEVDLEDYVGRPDKISNAEISAICQEAGMHAVRKNRQDSYSHRNDVAHAPMVPVWCHLQSPFCLRLCTLCRSCMLRALKYQKAVTFACMYNVATLLFCCVFFSSISGLSIQVIVATGNSLQ